MLGERALVSNAFTKNSFKKFSFECFVQSDVERISFRVVEDKRLTFEGHFFHREMSFGLLRTDVFGFALDRRELINNLAEFLLL